MSNIDELKKQLEEEKRKSNAMQVQLNNANQQLKGVLAQCKASKQLCDELTNSNIILRTNLILQQEHSAQRDQKLQQLEAEKAQPPVANPVPAKDTKAA